MDVYEYVFLFLTVSGWFFSFRFIRNDSQKQIPAIVPLLLSQLQLMSSLFFVWDSVILNVHSLIVSLVPYFGFGFSVVAISFCCVVWDVFPVFGFALAIDGMEKRNVNV